jgi:predicted metal-dependent phosphoesterase TrpH
LIDLHLHTTASDGRCEPAELLRRARRAGIHTLSVTDHDTVAAVSKAVTIGPGFGIDVVPGIEITAVLAERDVHVLGYFIDPDSEILAAFLAEQRLDRVRRVREIGVKLASLGKPIDVESIVSVSESTPGRSVGRPLVATALVKAGHVADIRQAFDELIGERQPAYVPRRGGTPAAVVQIIHRAGGIASLAHPGLLGDDRLIPELAKCGLAAIEAYHSEHDPAETTHYLSLAAQHGLAVSGGSDYHGDLGGRSQGLGIIGLPDEHYRVLKERAHRSSSSELAGGAGPTRG